MSDFHQSPSPHRHSSVPGSPYYMTTKKGKKKMSKDIKGALKTKRKLAQFIERTEKLHLNEVEIVSEEENKNQSDDDIIEITNPGVMDDEEEEAKTRGGLGAALLDVASREEAEDEDQECSHPHMRKFSAAGIFYRKLDCSSLLVNIEPPANLYFTGKAVIQVLKGFVDVYGFQFGANGKKYATYSAKGHSSLLSIRAISSYPENPLAIADHPNVSNEELLSMNGAVIVLEGFENEWCEGMRHIYPESVNFIGPSITGIGPAGKTPPQKSFMEKLGFQFVNSSRSDKIRLMEFPAFWNNIYSDLVNRFDSSNGKICPFGGKGVGKSSFVRWLTNRFLSHGGKDRVLFLDLDPGQTEFTPPGTISVHVCSDPILGPNFTHLRNAERAIFVGGVNVSDFPITYIKGVAELYEFCVGHEDFQGIPWIINTMGFSQGLGVHLACETVKIIRPTSVIQLTIDNDRRSFPFLLNKDNITSYRTFLSSQLSPKYREPLNDYVFLNVKSVCNREAASNTSSWGASPKVCRELVLMSYFAEKIGSAVGFTIRSVIPLCVPLDYIAIGTVNTNLNYGEIVETLNGNLVALCEISESHLQSVKGTQRKFINKAGNFSNNCLGYGIVRAVDKKNDSLYIISSLQDSDILSKVNLVLAAGAVGLPVHFYASSMTASSNEIPYIMNRNEGMSTLHTAAKKFFIPKRVTHSVLKNCLL